MKREARVLASMCRGRVCVAIVVRGPGVDGALASCTGCDGLCREAARRGYMGELRYHLGLCSCGLPVYPGSIPWVEELLSDTLDALAGLARARLPDPDPVP